jgi:hypothetical protein
VFTNFRRKSQKPNDVEEKFTFAAFDSGLDTGLRIGRGRKSAAPFLRLRLCAQVYFQITTFCIIRLLNERPGKDQIKRQKDHESEIAMYAKEKAEAQAKAERAAAELAADVNFRQ